MYMYCKWSFLRGNLFSWMGDFSQIADLYFRGWRAQTTRKFQFSSITSITFSKSRSWYFADWMSTAKTGKIWWPRKKGHLQYLYNVRVSMYACVCFLSVCIPNHQCIFYWAVFYKYFIVQISVHFLFCFRSGNSWLDNNTLWRHNRITLLAGNFKKSLFWGKILKNRCDSSVKRSWGQEPDIYELKICYRLFLN